ncbi:MAG: allantoicase [Candidatus Sericytochromatia bacterium]|nr:allantoicase [Candidatus Sericytochromatia bacterium]
MPSEFTDLIDLAAERLGGAALFANDEFFAEKENLLKAGRAIFIPDKYTERGKWMDGWETRRKRGPGHDFCVIRLGVPGRIAGFDIDTQHFLGNFPEAAAVDACVASPEASGEALVTQADWQELVPMSRLDGGSQNLFAVSDTRRFTHVRLRIYPDGGVARFRVHGEARPDWATLLASGAPLDLAAVEHGGVALLASDMFFSHRNNLIMPGRGVHMGDGWETKRRRGPGHDWVVLRLGRPGRITRAEVDTHHFKGNFPDQCAIEGASLPHDAPAEFLASLSIDWRPLLKPTALQADQVHVFTQELLPGGPYSHIRLNIFPDGGVSRLRLFGHATEERV